VVRRRRFDIFLVLYLTAIVAFAVVSRERERGDEEREERLRKLVSTFIPPLPMRFERDSVRWYVDADDESGLVAATVPPLETSILIHDIDPDDEIGMSMHSVTYNDTLIAPDAVAIGERLGHGRITDRTVRFPVKARFDRVGTYTVHVTGKAMRVHTAEQGDLEYRERRFDTTLVSRRTVEELERGRASLTVRVIDTSMSAVKTFESLRLVAERQDIASAIGFVETNIIQVNLGWFSPVVEIVRGGGRLVRISSSEKLVEYRWEGVVHSSPETVEIEARLDRQAGGKDVARVAFNVRGDEPVLLTPRSRVVYSGEELSMDLRVAGLTDENAYSWVLSEQGGPNELINKLEGRGPLVQYRLPNSYSGKTLVVMARYGGRPYRYISPRSYEAGPSVFSFPVVLPPVRIETEFPRSVKPSQVFRFDVSRFKDERFRGEQPVERLADVQVEALAANGTPVDIDLYMIRKGQFEFVFSNSSAALKAGRVFVTIHCFGATVRRDVQIVKS